jgi:hypothetical protein
MGEKVVAENIIKIPIEELGTVRLVCRRENCGGVAEIPVSGLEPVRKVIKRHSGTVASTFF